MAPDSETPKDQPENFSPEEQDNSKEIEPTPATEGFGGESGSPEEEDAALDREFEELLNQHLPGSQDTSRGELMELPVVAIREDSVLVDVGGKAEASVPLSEFPVVDGKPEVEVGQVIPVVQVGRGDGGVPRFSYRQARARLAKQAIREAMESRTPVKGLITDVVKGGVMVDIGVDGFMPASQVDLFKIPDLSTMKGREIEAYVLEFDTRRNRAVLSRRQLLFERRESERREFLETLEQGADITGKVKSALDFGVFVDLGVVDGFVPREEVSWDRGKSPGEVVKPGEELQLRILNVAPDSGKVTLSRKRLTDNPWENIDDRFPIGSTVLGTVVAIQSYGAFVHIEEGITGMIHASDMSWATGNKKPQDYVREGDEVTSQVLEIDKQKRRLSLGLKQLTKDPWADVETRFKPGTRVKGTVSSLTNYGAFVKLDDYLEGMVHVSDINWEKRVGHPKDYLKVGEEVEVVVLKIDMKDRRISLGIKQLQDSPFDAYLKENKVGSIVHGKVTRFAPFGAFVELADGLEGLIHISQIDEKRVELPESVLKPGDDVKVKIINVDRKNHKISLSRKEAIKAADRETVKQYMRKKDEQPGGMTFGEALRAAQEKQEENDE